MIDLSPSFGLRTASTLARACLDVHAGVDTVQARYGAAPGLRRLRFFNRVATQAFLAATDDGALLAFRGIEFDHLESWLADVAVVLVAGPGGRVHGGSQFGLESVWAELLQDLESRAVRPLDLFVTGHGVGGTLAVLCAARLAAAGHRPAGVYTFGQPRVGSADFCAAYGATMGETTYRFVNDADFVPHLPPRMLGYEHAGRFLWLGPKGGFVEDPGEWAQPLTASTSGSLFSLERFAQLKAAAPQGIQDHRIERYVEKIEGNLTRA